MANKVILYSGGKLNGFTGTITGQALVWNQTTLTWGADGVALAGDLSGTTSSSTVVALQGNPVTAGALSVGDAGKALVWSGTGWNAATLSGGGIGGGGLIFYMDAVSADAPTPAGTFYALDTAFDEAPTWTASASVANDAAGTLLASFLTNVNSPGAGSIPAGIWELNIYANATDGANSTGIRFKVYKVAGTTPTLLATSDYVYVTNPDVVTSYTPSVYLPAQNLNVTDRIAIEIEGRRYTSPAHTITLSFGAAYITHLHTTINAPGGTGVLKVVAGYLQSPASLVVASDIETGAVTTSKILPGADGQVLTTTLVGPTLTTVWTSPAYTGTVTQVVGGTGLDGGTITGSGTLSVKYGSAIGTAAQGNDTRLPPTPSGLGKIIYDTGAAYTALDAGTSGYFLKSNGAAAPSWAAAASGTVTSVSIASGSSAYASIANGSSTPEITLTVGSAGGLAAFSDTRFPPTPTGTGSILYVNSSSAYQLLAAGANDKVLTLKAGLPSWELPASSGTVTSVTLDFGTTGLLVNTATSASITSSGTFAVTGTLAIANGGTGTASLSLANANKVFASPNGAGGAPSFRSLVAADIPPLPASQITSIPYDISGMVPGTAPTTTVVWYFIAVRPCTIEAAAGVSTVHRGYAVTAPSAATQFTIKDKLGTSVGTIDYATSSNTATFTNSAISLAAGDWISVTSPAAGNNIANLFFTFKATA